MGEFTADKNGSSNSGSMSGIRAVGLLGAGSTTSL